MVYLHVDVGTGASTAERASGWAGPLQALDHLHRAVVEGREAPVVFVTSTVAGLGGVGLARAAAVGISPMSGAVAETRAEGPFAAGLRASGVVGVSLTGTAALPSYVLIERGRASVHPAGELWGMGTHAATDALLARHGPDAAVAVIGPAGEAGTRYASVVTCRHFPFPRLGFGALLGARRIKAVVCKGGGPGEPVHDPDGVEALTQAYRDEMPDHPLASWQFTAPGFGAWPGTVTGAGYAAVRNFADTATAPAVAWPGLHPDSFADHASGVASCPGCPNDCIKTYADAGLHQEAVAALGPGLGIGDLGDVLAANALCEDLGLDPVSLGGTLACLLPLHEPLLDLVRRAATAGHPLGEGAYALAARLGVPERAMVSRRIELPPFDPRVQPGLGLMYAAAPIGPRYDAVEHDLDFDPERGLPHSYPEARRLGLTVPAPASTLDVERTLLLADLWSGLDALLICPYASTPTRPLSLDRICALVIAVTGRPIQPGEVLALGRERLRRQQAINDLLGIGPGTLPARFFREPVAEGAFRGAVLDEETFTAAVDTLRSAWR